MNNVLIETYWAIGHGIVARQQEQGWDDRVFERLSTDLRTAYHDMHALSARNLRYTATLATRWPSAVGQRKVTQLRWGLVMASWTTARTARPQTSTRSGPLPMAGGEELQAMIASRLREWLGPR